MISRNRGEKDTDVLRQLRQFGLHPAVRVFENRVARTWSQMSVNRTRVVVTDHRPLLRLVIGNQTA